MNPLDKHLRLNIDIATHVLGGGTRDLTKLFDGINASGKRMAAQFEMDAKRAQLTLDRMSAKAASVTAKADAAAAKAIANAEAMFTKQSGAVEKAYSANVAKLNRTYEVMQANVEKGVLAVERAKERADRLDYQRTQAQKRSNADAAAEYERRWTLATKAVAREQSRLATMQGARNAFGANLPLDVATLSTGKSAMVAGLRAETNLQNARAQESANAQFNAARDQEEAARLQLAAARKQATSAARMEMVSRGGRFAGTAGNVVAGTGLGILGGAAELAKMGANYQSTVFTTGANTILSPSQIQRMGKLSLRISGKTGADYNDVLQGFKNAADLGYGFNPNLITAAYKTALPTGGSVADMTRAIAIVGNDYPKLKGNPLSTAAMLLTAARRGNTTVPNLVNAIPRLLALGSRLGIPLPQIVGAVSALTESGMSIDDAQMLVYNMIAHLISPSGSQLKFVNWLKKTKGVDLTDVFGHGLQNRGLTGVLGEIRSANLDKGGLKRLLPDIRGFFGALGLTSGTDFFNPTVQATTAAGNASADKNPVTIQFKNWLGLTSVQMGKLTAQLKITAITLGTDLLPIFNRWMKEDLVPGVKALDKFTKAHKTAILWLVKASPWLITFGLGLKAVGLAVKGFAVVRDFAAAIGLIKPAASAAEVALGLSKTAGLAGSLGTVESQATKLTGVKGGKAGILGLSGAIGELAIVVGGFLAILAATKIAGDAGKKSGNSLLDFLINNTGPVGTGIGLQVALLQKLGLHIPGVTGSAAKPAPTSAQALVDAGNTSYVYQGRAWNKAGVSNTPNIGRSFGSSFPYGVTSSIPIPPNHYPKWWSGALGAPASQIFDTDFGSAGLTNKPFELPGNTKKAWTFVGYVPDSVNSGQDIALWKDPMGNVMGFNHVDPRGVLAHGRWTKLQPGDQRLGGQMVGVSLANHLSIDTTPAVRKDLMVLTNHGKMKKVVTGRKRLPQIPAGIPFKVARYWPIITKYAKQYHLDPFKVAAIIWSESNGNPGADNGVAYGLMQIYHTNIDKGVGGITWHNWKNPDQNIKTGCMILAGAFQGVGTNFYKALNRYSGGGNEIADFQGSGKTYYAFTRDNANAWEGIGRSTSGSGGTGGTGGTGGGVDTSGYGGTGPKTPADWVGYWGGKMSDVTSDITSLFGSHPDPSTMSPADRTLYYTLVDRAIKAQYQQSHSTYNATMMPGANRQRAMARAASKRDFALKHPDRWATNNLNITGSKRPDPRLNHLRGIIAGERGQLGGITNRWRGVNVNQLPATGGHGYNLHNWLQDQIKKDKINREIADNTAKIHKILWKEPQGWLYQQFKQNKANQAAADAAARRRAHHLPGGGAASGVVPVHIIGRCAAEAAANVHRKETAGGVKTTNKNLNAIHGTLKQIHAAIVAGAMGGIKAGQPHHGHPKHHVLQMAPINHPQIYGSDYHTGPSTT